MTAYFDNFTITEVKQEEEEEVTPPADALVFDDFSSLDNWTDISTDKTTNYSYIINSDEQLAITLNAGRTNDVFLKYNGTVDSTKKLAFEVDLTISGDVSSNFEAGFELKNGAKWVATASIAKGYVKTQWSGTDTAVDEQTHTLKIVTDPETATVDVYLDGNVVLENAAYLQEQTTWNTIQLFVKGNNSASPLTAYFDNFTVTEVTELPEPVFETVDANALVADEDNWSSTAGATVEFKNGTVAVSGDADKINSYTGKTFKNTVFNFTYKQENTGSGWGGFGIIQSPERLPWSSNKCLLICMKEDKVEYQFWGTKHSGVIENVGDYLKDGEEQEITFGMYDVDPETNKVAIVLSIDGQKIFDVVVEDAVMSGFEGYLTTIGGSGVTAVLGKETEELPEPVFETVDANALVADEDNWSSTAGATVEFKNGTVAVSGDADKINSYTGKTFKNTVFNFTYKQENTGSGWGGFGIIQSPERLPWSSNKCLLICMKEDKVEYQFWGTKHSGVIENVGDYLKDGEEQEITFGMYDVDPETNKVAIVLSIDGQKIFDVVVEDAVMSGFEGYLTTIGGSGVTAVLGKEEKTPVLTEDFSTVSNWSKVTGNAGSWSYTSDEGKLQISVDPGTQNIAKIYSNDYGWEWIQKKISIEFDIVSVDKNPDSNFVIGFSLMQWNTNVFTVNIHKGILRTNWTGTGIDVSDGNHRVKIVSDPTTNTFAVYLDGEMIAGEVPYLTGSSWNRFGFFADTNNSQNIMSACFDNLTVTVIE